MQAYSLLETIERPPSGAEQLSFEELMAAEEEWSAPSEDEAPSAPRQAAIPVSGRHQDVRLYITLLLKTFVEMTDAGKVRDTPFEVRFADGSRYQPDIAFISFSRLDRLNDTYFDGGPDLIVEVVSAETTALDRGEKFAAYEAGGVREYWLIDPARELADLYHLGPDGYYDAFRPDIAGRLRSRLLHGFTLDIDRLWQRVMPTTAEVVEMAQGMVGGR